MAKLTALIREYIISLADPREPAKLFLGELWDNLLPPKDQKDLLVDAIYEALLIESRTHELVWTKDEIRKVVTVDIETIDLEGLDNKTLVEELKKTFRDVPFVPERTRNSFDFEQIATNVLKIALAKFDQKLHEPENQKLRIDLIEKYARHTGMSVKQIEDVFNISLANIERELSLLNEKFNIAMSNLMDLIQSIDNALIKISQGVNIINSSASTTDYQTNILNISDKENKTILGQLENYKLSLEAYKISWSRYVAQRDIPVQDVREVMFIISKVDELLKSLDFE